VNLSFESMSGEFPGGSSEAATLAPTWLPVIDVDSLIVGGGPAGLAPLVAASRSFMLEQILSRGLTVVERGATIGSGSIGSYAIKSDSTAETLVSCVYGNPNPHLAKLRDHPAAMAVAAYGNGPVPLKLVGAFMAAVGGVLHDLLTMTPGCTVLLGHVAIETRQTRDGLWCTELQRIADGTTRTIRSRLVVLATGGHQPSARLENYNVAGVQLLPRYASKLVQSNHVLTAAGLTDISHRLAAGRSKHVAIIGSSSSAMACANAMLHLNREPRSSANEVTVLHRRPLRIFYPSAEVALAEGYTEFGPDDICPISGFIFRFAGFRLESRELVMAARGIGGRVSDSRLRLHRLTANPDPALQLILEEADVIVAALGYRPLALPVVSASGCPIPLYAHGPGKRALVDDQCRVLDRTGAPIAGLLGIGLAAGFISPDTSGGEPSFSGQTNGLWQWQNEVGVLIASQLGGECTFNRGSGTGYTPSDQACGSHPP
jgi:hypothetical protein